MSRPRGNLSASASVGFGVTAVMLGLCGIIPCGILLAVTAFVPASLAVVLSQVGLVTSDQLRGTGRRLARAGLVLGCVGVALIFVTPTLWALWALVR